MAIDQLVYSYVADEVSYPDEAVIIEEGSKGDWVYVILEGHVKVKKRTPKGMVAIDTLKEGAVFGEMALFEKGKELRSASVVAADGPVRVGILDSERLAGDYNRLSPQIKALIRSLIVRLKQTSEKICAIVVASR